jgi:hypothetical protein
MLPDAAWPGTSPALSPASLARLSTAESFCVAAYGARVYLFSHPPFRLRMRSPLGWANFATRLRRWVIWFFAFCRSENSSLCRMQKRWMAHAWLQRSRSLTRAASAIGTKVATASRRETVLGPQTARDSGWHLEREGMDRRDRRHRRDRAGSEKQNPFPAGCVGRTP